MSFNIFQFPFSFIKIGASIAPIVTSISPTSGITADGSGTPVTITGSGFASGATVTIGGTACTSVVVNSPTSINCTTGAHAQGASDVVVTSGGSATLASAYIYNLPNLVRVPGGYGDDAVAPYSEYNKTYRQQYTVPGIGSFYNGSYTFSERYYCPSLSGSIVSVVGATNRYSSSGMYYYTGTAGMLFYAVLNTGKYDCVFFDIPTASLKKHSNLDAPDTSVSGTCTLIP